MDHYVSSTGDPVDVQAEEPAFRLQDFERDSALWLKISQSVEKRLIELRISNDYPLKPLETAYLRGKIAAMKEFLEAGSPPDAHPDDLDEN